MVDNSSEIRPYIVSVRSGSPGSGSVRSGQRTRVPGRRTRGGVLRTAHKLLLGFIPARVAGFWVNLAAAFLAGLVGVSGQFYPFGMGVALAAAQARTKANVLGALTGFVVSALVVRDPYSGIWFISGTCIACTVYAVFPSFFERLGMWSIIAGSLVIWAPVALYGYLMDMSGLALCLYLCEALTAHVFANLVRPAQRRTSLSDQGMPADRMMAFGILIWVALVGLDATISSVPRIGEVIARWLILVLSFSGGPSSGAVFGLGYGALASMAGPDRTVELAQAAVYGLTGVMAGLLSTYGKLGVTAAAVFGWLLGTHAVPSGMIAQSQFFSLAISSLWFALTPRRLLVPLETILGSLRRVEREHSAATEPSCSSEEADVLARLECFCTLFEEFAATASHRAGPDERTGTDVQHFLGELQNRLCSGCRNYRKCWNENFFRTYWDAVSVLAALERGTGITAGLTSTGVAQECVRMPKLFKISQEIVDVMRMNEYWRNKMHEGKMEAVDRLTGMVRLFKSLLGEFQGDSRLDTAVEDEMSRALRAEIEGFLSAGILQDGRRGLRIEVLIDSGENIQEVESRLEAVASRVMGSQYVVWYSPEELPGKFSLIQSPKYAMATRVLTMPGTDGTLNGDRYDFAKTPHGRYALILSDGMGMGKTAAVQSGATVSMLKRMLESGFGPRFSVQAVNAALLMRPLHESFATVDLLILDPATGAATFLKTGACPSYLKRSGTVEVIEASSLPAGIVGDVNPAETVRRLGPGDVVVTVTDGALEDLESDGSRHQRTTWVSEALMAVDSTDPDAILSFLTDKQHDLMPGGFQDDLTIMVSVILPFQGTVDASFSAPPPPPEFVRTY